MPFQINSVTVSGNLTKDPELRSTSGGVAVANFRLAFNERRKNSAGEWDDHAGYVSVTVWKGQGEWLAGNVKKGDGIVVSGRLHFNEWDANDGGKRSELTIVANDVQVIRQKDGGSSSAPRADAGGQPPPPSDDDIPF